MNAIDIEIPDGKVGNWSVESFTVTKADSDRTRMRAAFGRPDEFVPAGDYKRLCRGREVIMSNTPMELRTNRSIIRMATGHVLINGLGLGMIVTEILKNPKVTAITVIEKEADVIELVGSHLMPESRLTIIHADAFTYQPPKGLRFSAVWHDIWDNICSDNLAEMTKLTRKYARRTDWQDCWGRYECERARQRGW